MRIVDYIAKSFKAFPATLKLAPVALLIGTLGEGFQHLIELWLGMYESIDAFRENATSLERLGGGAVKIVGIFASSYLAAAALTKAYGVVPSGRTFGSHFFKTAWEPVSGIVGAVSILIVSLPLLWCHLRLNTYAIGHDFASPLLILDSLFVGLLSVMMGAGIWATEFQAEPIAKA